MTNDTPGNPLNIATPVPKNYLAPNNDDGASRQNNGVFMMLGNNFFVQSTKYGGMGEVFLCSYKENELPEVALKTFQKQFFYDPRYRISFENEAVIWSLLSGLPHIMPVLGIGEFDSRVFVMVPCVRNADNINTLRDRLNAGTSKVTQRFKYFFQCALCMKFANEHLGEMVHGDLKPENLMLIADDIFITDFGLAKTMSGLENRGILDSLESTWAYRAPELWKDNNAYSVKSDIYAMGIILYELLTGALPFTGVTRNEFEAAHTAGFLPVPVISENLQPFLELAVKCMDKNPFNRPDYQELLNEFSNAWSAIDVINHFDVLYKEVRLKETFQAFQAMTKESVIRGLNVLNRPDLALKEIENLEMEVTSPAIKKLKATALSLLNRDKEAIEVFEEMLSGELTISMRTNCINELGISYKRLKRFDDAERLYLKELLPGCDKKNIPVMTTNLAGVYLMNGQYDKGIACLSGMLKDYPDTADGWGNLGICYSANNQFDNAIDAYGKAIALKPGKALVQVYQAEAYLNTGRVIESYELLDSVWKQGYFNEHWLEAMVAACYFAGKNDEIQELLQKAEQEIGKENTEKLRNRLAIKIDKINKNYNKYMEEQKIEKTPAAIVPKFSISNPAKFSLPFMNFRQYLEENTYSIEYYGDMKQQKFYHRSFGDIFKMHQHDKNTNFGKMLLRSTLFYFTQCPNCRIQILTNRDERKVLTCRQCSHSFETEEKTDDVLEQLLKDCMSAAGFVYEKKMGLSVLVVVQPYPGDDLELMRRQFLKHGYSERTDQANKQVQYVAVEMINRGVFAKYDKVFGFEKDYPAGLVGYDEPTPPSVMALIRNLRDCFPRVRSTSHVFETNPADIATMMFTGKYKEALVALEAEIKEKGMDYHLLSLKVLVLIDCQQYDNAIAVATELLSAHPNNGRAWSLMGKALAKSGQSRQAIDYYERAMRMDPVDAEPVVGLFTCYRDVGDTAGLNKIQGKLRSLGMI